MSPPTAIATILAFPHSAGHHCCVFEGTIQPRLLDTNHFYVALGSGKLAADPFLRFLVDIFCPNGQPKVREAIFLATWTCPIRDHLGEMVRGTVEEALNAMLDAEAERRNCRRERKYWINSFFRAPRACT